jgi:stage III sporulation protein AG
MKEKDGTITSFKEWLKGKEGPKSGKLSKNEYMILILIVGIAFMLFANFFKGNGTGEDDPQPVAAPPGEDEEAFRSAKESSSVTMAVYEDYYEEQLKESLEAIAGVDEVKIVVNVGSTERTVYEKNTVSRRQTTDETDASGGKRKIEDSSTEEQVVFVREGERDVPLVAETRKPEIKGVLVVAKGAENIQVRKSIKEAVMKTLDVPSHRVAVLAKD